MLPLIVLPLKTPTRSSGKSGESPEVLGKSDSLPATRNLADVSDIFYFFLLGEGEGGSLRPPGRGGG